MCRLACVLVLVAGCSGRPRSGLGEVPLALDAPLVLELGEASLPIVEVVLDGHAAAFLVDSGSSISVLDPVRAAELGLAVRPYAGNTSTRGSSGRSVVIDRYVAVERMELGPLVLERTALAALDDDVLRRGLHSGILGQDLLGRLPLVLDMERRALHLLPPGTDRDGIRAYLEEADLGAGAWAVVEIDFRPCPFLPLDAHETELVEIEVDTGATDTSLPEPVIAALDLPLAGPGTVGLVGVGGSRQSPRYLLEDLGLFGLRVRAEVHANALEYGLLGMDVLGEFVVVLDGPGESLWLHHRTVEPDTSALPVGKR